MPERYDVLPRQHIPVLQTDERLPSEDPKVNFSTIAELGYTTDQAVTESTRCLMCNYNIWFDGFRCVLCGACADVCPEGVIHMIDVNQMKSEGALPELVDGYGWTQGAAMVLDEERCIRCALCVKRCPYDAITMENNKAFIDSEKCVLCRKCVAECPTSAILELNFPPPRKKEPAEVSETESN